MSPNAVRCMWNGFPIGPFKPPTPLRYRQIRWLGSFVAWSSRITEGSWETWSPGKPEAVRAFGDEDVEYLAPLLVEGLTRAASDQQVGFRVVQVSAPIHSQSGGLIFCLSSVRFPGACESEQPLGATSEESTEGSLYAYGRSLYLTLTEYRHRTGTGRNEYHGQSAHVQSEQDWRTARYTSSRNPPSARIAIEPRAQPTRLW